MPRPSLYRHRSLPVIAEDREYQQQRRTSVRSRRPIRTSSFRTSFPATSTASSSPPRCVVSPPVPSHRGRSLCDDEFSTPPPPPPPPNVLDCSNLDPLDRNRATRLRECAQNLPPGRALPPPRRLSHETPSPVSRTKLTLTRREEANIHPSTASPPNSHHQPTTKASRPLMYPSLVSVECIPDDFDSIAILNESSSSTASSLSHAEVSQASFPRSSNHSATSTLGQSFHDEMLDNSNSTMDSTTLESAEPLTTALQETPPPNLNPYAHMSSTNFEERRSHRNNPVYIEIEPGRKELLRGTAEMIRALQLGCVRTTTCLACSCDMLCLATVAWVVCPDCRSISPTHADDVRPGVGLGMKL